GQNRQISGAELRLDQNTLSLFRQQHLAQLCNMARPWLSFRVEGEGAGLVESVVADKMSVSVMSHQESVGFQWLEQFLVGGVGVGEGRLKLLQTLLEELALFGHQLAEQRGHFVRRGERKFGT